MKNELEAQLRSWELRRASPRVRQSIFASKAREEYRPALAERWLVPAMAAAIVMFTVFNHRNTVGYQPIDAADSVGALMLSNQSPTTPLPAISIQARNSIGDSFEWTNCGGFSTSSVPSLRGTNL